ncbi:MAG: cell wall hydrolase [Devosia sp.]
MALFGPPAKAIWARPEHSLRGVIASLVLSLLLSPLLIGGAQGPGIETGPTVETAPAATIMRVGDELIITGSIGHLFNTGLFAGPNRSEKTNRARPTPDGVDVSSGFDAVRVRLAELRTPGTTISGDTAIAVASIDPSQTNGALEAIAGMSVAPFPASPSKQLAYARESGDVSDLPVTGKDGNQVSEKELWCMATAIYFEARGESYRGQVAVGQVVMNRVAHRLYPDAICAVVFQNQQMRNACQFSFACDGIPETVTDKTSWAQAMKIARGVIDGTLYLPEVEKATHYHATYVYPDWAPRLKKVTKIGHHIFYKFKRRA